jgi:hypothetical protein
LLRERGRALTRGAAQVAPTRAARGQGAWWAGARASAAPGAAPGAVAAADEPEPAPACSGPDDLLPRADLGALITPRLLSSLSRWAPIKPG